MLSQGEVKYRVDRKNSHLDLGSREWIVGFWKQKARGALRTAGLNAELKT